MAMALVAVAPMPPRPREAGTRSAVQEDATVLHEDTTVLREDATVLQEGATVLVSYGSDDSEVSTAT